MREAGVKVDAVSLGEIERALAAGYTASALGRFGHRLHRRPAGRRPRSPRWVAEGIPVNAGSIDMLRQLGAASPGHRVWLRINPGFGHGHSNKTNTGGEHSKHGIWHSDLPAALDVIRATGLQLVGLHMHIGSGVDYSHLQQVCQAMVDAGRARGPAASRPFRRGGACPFPTSRARPASTLRTTTACGTRARQGRSSECAWPRTAPGDRTRPLSGGRVRCAAGRGARHQGRGPQSLSRSWMPASTTSCARACTAATTASRLLPSNDTPRARAPHGGGRSAV